MLMATMFGIRGRGRGRGRGRTAPPRGSSPTTTTTTTTTTRLGASLGTIIVLLGVLGGTGAQAATYEVGPGMPLAEVGDVPWESLAPGDTVLIHWRDTPYNDKFVVAAEGTEAMPVIVRGVPNESGQLPIIDAAAPRPARPSTTGTRTAA